MHVRDLIAASRSKLGDWLLRPIGNEKRIIYQTLLEEARELWKFYAQFGETVDFPELSNEVDLKAAIQSDLDRYGTRLRRCSSISPGLQNRLNRKTGFKARFKLESKFVHYYESDHTSGHEAVIIYASSGKKYLADCTYKQIGFMPHDEVSREQKDRLPPIMVFKIKNVKHVIEQLSAHSIPARYHWIWLRMCGFI